ncbi:MAG: argininosuccinate synthase [Prevotellaceae bacterium]|jgi:argininosuccinate synthase|nr:argininosuccinate synthase [Prevotellaceae bacterium]
MNKNNKVLLAFSGGLDTSFCVQYLKNERNLEVHTALVNTGGFNSEELKAIEQKALELGVASHKNIDKIEEFYRKGIRYMIFGNSLRQNTYPLSVSSERIFQALAIVDCAKEIDAAYIAHGSTGAGNDQVRFDLVFQVVAPEIEIITPIRELRLSRQEEIDYLAKHGYAYNWEKAKYSINQGLWGTSVGGAETLLSDGVLPESAYPVQAVKQGNEKIVIEFENGEPVGLNGKKLSPETVIREIENIAAPYGIGRDIHIGDTIIGIKGRVGFEAAAALIVINAHRLLEKHVLTKWQQYWKDQIGNWYGMMMHEAQYLEPVMRDMEAFLESSQKFVTGSVDVCLQPYHFNATGCRTEHDLMSSKFGEYGEINKAFSGDDVKGFTKILSNQMKIYYAINSTDTIN